MKALRKIATKLKSLLLILVLAIGQIAAASGPFITPQQALAAPVCVNDTAGANDEPGQKDLTKLCVDYAGVPTTVATTWNWDNTGTSGNNSMDACNLFDTDNDGNVNYAVCVTTNNDPATFSSLTTYSCGDDKIDRCTSPASVISSGTTSCNVSQQNTDPFPSGTSSPADTQGACTVQLSTVGGATARLVDVCSYPSQQPNSDPSDCVIARNNSGKVEVIKNLVPANNPGLFNLSVDGPGTNNTVTVNDRGHNGTTGEVVVTSGVTVVGEAAGTGTNLAGYSTTIVCRDLNGTGAIIAQGSAATLNVTVADDADVVCVITNTAAGSITIVKDAVPNALQDFSFTTTGTGLSNFSLDDDSGVGGADAILSNTRTFNNLSAGTYTVNESAATGWDLSDLDCAGAVGVTESATGVSINLTAGQNVTCTFTNTQRGHLIVQKTTVPAADPTQFTINASGSGTITGGGAGIITDATDKDYEVTPGTYSVAETVPAGWTKTGDTCQNVVVAAGATVTCLITNTRNATLNIIKDALPNHEQNFGFTTTNLGGAAFSLDDDADGTLPNNQSFTGLLPGSYSVTESATPGWSLTGLTCDTNNFNAVGSTVTVNLAAGQTTNCTFTNTKLVSISGTKYTSNALASFGTVLAGWTIFIDANGNGTLDQGELSAITDVNGDYSFVDLMPGSFTLAEVLQAGWTQIFAPGPFTLAAGQDAVDKDFGNFQNGSIGGFKWNDLNGNGTFDNEPKLSGWTITLFDVNNQPVGSPAVTDVNGNYSFTNLAPGTYSVCETAQANWVQTFPAGNACHTIIINISGESNTANFGNQGRGNIRVNKNVDTDGDGDVDVTGATNWTWDIAGGAQNTATGSSQNVAAGTYTVNEDQMPNFHVVSVVCDTQVNAVSESAQVVVTPGANVTCTFTNARDTGTITVRKVVNPTNDTGLFNLQIDGQTAGTGANVGHGGGTGTIQVPTGTHSVSETAGTNTSLLDYASSFSCSNNLNGNGTSTGNFTVSSGDNITCTFTNTRLGHIIVQKQTDPDGSPESFEFDTSYDFLNFSLSDGQQNDSGNLQPGIYSVAEIAEAGWDLTSAVCSDQSNPASIDLAAGETVTCVFRNTQDANIVVVKQTDPNGDPQIFSFNASYDADGFSLSDGQQNNSGDLDPGTYSVSENVPAGWDLDSVTCSDGSLPGNVSLQAGETVTCTFNNEKDAKIIVIKQTDPDGSTQQFSFTASYDADGFSLSDGQQNDSGDLDPGIYSVGEVVPNGWQLENAQCSDGSDSSAIGLSAGETVTCTFTNEQDANIVIVKQTNPDGHAQVFNFTASYDGDGFSLSDGQSNNSGDLNPGTYSVSETVPAGWDLDSVVCSDGSNPNTINLSAGETVTCTFTNEQDAQIIIAKETNPDGSAQVFSFNASYDGDGFSLSDGQSNNSGDLDPGAYSVSENVPAGWDLDSVVCSDQSDPSSINLSAGETVTCTFTNEQDANIVVVKQTNPDGDPQQFSFNASYDGDGFSLSDGQQNDSGDLDPGSYTVSENVPAGWDLDSVTCSDGSLPGAINLSAGETVTCTFTNEKDAKIIVIKQTHPDGSQQAFNFTASYDGDGFSLSDDQSNDSGDLDPGTYTVSETVPAGWDQTNVTCDDGSLPNAINLSAGEIVTCTFTNEQDANIIVVKQTLPDGDETDFDFHADYDADGFSLSDGDQNDSGDLDPDTYSISEDTPEGWDLDSVTCSDESDPSNITLSAGETVTCTFVNHKRGQVIVTKYNDFDRDGEKDADEPVIPDWEFTLQGEADNYNYLETQSTGQDGTTPFNNVKPGVEHELNETLPNDSWHLSNIDCGERDGSLDGDTYFFGSEGIAPGETVNCFVGNYRDVVLLIEKSNNRPAPTNVGDTVTYTLTVTVPEDSGPSHNTIANDLPPEGFTYVPGSWTATSSVRGDLTPGVTPEPTYGSPGTWLLGLMLPGEVVTLTYRAVIGTAVSPGTYPDVAFALGCEAPVGDCEVLSNVSAGASSPFVATRVTIRSPQVLAANTTVLVDTGAADIWRNMMAATLLVGLAFATLVKREKKGYRL